MCIINPHLDSKTRVCVCVSVLFSTSVCVDLVFNVESHPLNVCWIRLLILADPPPRVPMKDVRADL